MKYLNLLLLIFCSHHVIAISITDFYLYQTDYDIKTKEETLSVYLLKNEPCIIVESFKNKEKNKYCELGDSGLNLSKEFPSIRVYDLSVSGPNIYFKVAAPWNEQSCRIFVPKKEISCEPTGRN